MKIENGIKTLEVGNGEFLHFWYSNNRGRGKNNCTIIRSTASRADLSKDQTGIITQTRISSWRGKVNLSKSVREALGI